jgi:hypothetical protein
MKEYKDRSEVRSVVDKFRRENSNGLIFGLETIKFCENLISYLKDKNIYVYKINWLCKYKRSYKTLYSDTSFFSSTFVTYIEAKDWRYDSPFELIGCDLINALGYYKQKGEEKNKHISFKVNPQGVYK